MKRYTHILAFLLLTIISCKAQTIRTLGEPPVDLRDVPKPIYTKDINNIRAPYIGVWRGSINNKQLTIYLYKKDGVPVGYLGAKGEAFVDGIMGYYIYKENGITQINSKNRLLEPHVPNDQRYGPLFGITGDGMEMTSMRFVDYGIEIQNPDGSYSPKPAKADMVITNPDGNPLKMSFKLKNPVRGVIGGTYNLEFSIPTNMVLTKISNTPPPLD